MTERTYSGQCKHGIPLGSWCEKCKGMPNPFEKVSKKIELDDLIEQAADLHEVHVRILLGYKIKLFIYGMCAGLFLAWLLQQAVTLLWIQELGI